MNSIGQGFGAAIVTLCIACFLIPAALWGIWELIDYFFIGDVLRCSEQAFEGIELIIKNNQVDTVYVYTCPR